MLKRKPALGPSEPDSPRQLEFSDLCVLEPRLLLLRERTRTINDDLSSPHFCANDVWYDFDGLRNAMAKLVGWHAEKDIPGLRTSEAYSAAYQVPYHDLPGCRNCACFAEPDATSACGDSEATQ